MPVSCARATFVFGFWLTAFTAAQVTAFRPLYEQALAERLREFGPWHPKVAQSARDLGLFLATNGDATAAEGPLRQALQIDEKELGPEHGVTAADRENLASVLDKLGRNDEAAALCRLAAVGPDAAVAARCFARLGEYSRALEAEEKASGKAHPRVAVRLNDWGLWLQKQGEPREAEAVFRRALAIQEKALGAGHPETAVTLNNLASLLLSTGKVAAAETMQRRALRVLEEKLGPRHVRVATAASNLADILLAKGDRAGAERLYRRALEIDEAVYGPDHPEVAADRANLESLSKAR